MVAAATVAIGVAVTVAIHYATGVPMSTMVGILSGAVTNTPGLGAATQTYTDITNLDDPSISLGYAVAYPLGVIGIIGSLIFLKYAFRISPDREYAEIERRKGLKIGADRITLVVGNPSLEGRTIDEVQELADRHFVISRNMRGQERENRNRRRRTASLNYQIKFSWLPNQKTSIFSWRFSGKE